MVSHQEQEPAPVVEGPAGEQAVGEERRRRRRHYRRYLIAGVLVALLTASITASVNQHRRDYDDAALDNLCDKIDMTPLHQANPFATRSSSTASDSDGDLGGSGYRDGGRVQYCDHAYVGDDGEAVLSQVRVAAAVYPSQRDAALAYNQAASGDIGRDRFLDSHSFDGPLVSVVRPIVRIGTIHTAAGIDAPEAFCVPLATTLDLAMKSHSQSGYVIAARDSNLLVEVYVQLTGSGWTWLAAGGRRRRSCTRSCGLYAVERPVTVRSAERGPRCCRQRARRPRHVLR